MNEKKMTAVLEAVAAGEKPVSTAMNQFKHIFSENIDFAHIDHHRSIRKGFPEVIFGERKTAEQILGIIEKMMLQETVVLVTRIDAEKAGQVRTRCSGAVYDSEARILLWQKGEICETGRGEILIVSAGTSDIPVAREAELTAKAMGNKVETIFDVGVSGIHRLFQYRHQIETATVVIVVAGMEGALPSVVAGMTGAPVIAVPTSVGYGVSLNGMTALFAMLNSCSSNVAVVNIDNGFGAGYMASSINHR